MSASDNHADIKPVTTDAAADQAASNVEYGKILKEARKLKTMSIEDVARSINVSADIIESIESSSTVGLPPPTFVQGYLRAYARHVEVSVEQVLQDFARAVPHKSESELQARSSLPKEASSHSPLFKMLTRVILFIIVFVILFGIYRYYTDKVDRFAADEASQAERLVSGSDLVGSGDTEIPEIQQRARMTDDGELIVESEAVQRESSLLQQEQAEYDSLASSLEDNIEKAVSLFSDDTAVSDPSPEPVMSRDDRLTIYTDQDSWVEISDAAGTSLFYNLLKEGSKRNFEGAAPFDVFIGNAPAVELQVNGVDIEMTNFTRSNNIAQFRVSTNDGEPVFHSR